MTQGLGGRTEARAKQLGVHCLTGRSESEAVLRLLRPLANLIEEAARTNGGANGYCRGCSRWVWFSLADPQPGGWANVMEGMVCECGLNGRMRGILASVDSLEVSDGPLTDAIVFEHVTPMFPLLRERLPQLAGSEFLGPECQPGTLHETRGLLVRHESMLAPTYAEASLDLVMHFDVLEHIPDPVAALVQCWRILRPGGRLLFSCPFYEELNESIIRARIEDGQLLHDLPPCYHGNPVDGDGALVFTQFGWDMLGMIERAGFVDVELWLNFNPAEGVLTDGCPYPDGHAWPIVFVARKQLQPT